MAQSKSSRPTHTVDFIPSATRDAVFLQNPVLDNMMHAILARGAEVWADERRLKIIESLLDAKRGVVDASASGTNATMGSRQPSRLEDLPRRRTRSACHRFAVCRQTI